MAKRGIGVSLAEKREISKLQIGIQSAEEERKDREVKKLLDYLSAIRWPRVELGNPYRCHALSGCDLRTQGLAALGGYCPFHTVSASLPDPKKWESELKKVGDSEWDAESED